MPPKPAADRHRHHRRASRYFLLVAPVGHMFGIDVGGHGVESKASPAVLWTQAGLVRGRLHRWIFLSKNHQRHPWVFFRALQDVRLCDRGIWQNRRRHAARPVIVLLVYGGLIALTLMGSMPCPRDSFPIRNKDIWSHAQLPDGASLARTDDVIRRLSEHGPQTEGVAYTIGSCRLFERTLSTNISNVGGPCSSFWNSSFGNRAG